MVAALWSCSLVEKMSYRSVRESLIGGRNIPAVSQHRRGRSLTSISNSNSKVDSSAAVADENLDLFSKNRRTLSVTSSDESSDGTSRSQKLRRFNSCSELNWSPTLPSILRVVEVVKLRRFSNCALEFGLLFFIFQLGNIPLFFVFLYNLIGAIIIVLYVGITKYTVSVKLGRLSIGSAKLSRSGIDDLLSSTDGGKHDYDW